MRRLGRWGLGVALLVCLSAPAVAADTGADDSNPGWFSRWFGGSKKAPDKKPAAEAKPAEKEHAVKPDLSVRPETPPVDELAVERAHERANYLRRLLVCDRLEEMTSDPDLLQRVDQLRQRVKMIYAQRTAYMPAAGAANVDEQTLNKHLGGQAETPAYTVHGDDSISRTASWEEKR